MKKIDSDADGLLTKGNGGRWPGDREGCVPRSRVGSTRGGLTGRGLGFVRVPSLAQCPRRRKRDALPMIQLMTLMLWTISVKNVTTLSHSASEIPTDFIQMISQSLRSVFYTVKEVRANKSTQE